MRTTARRLTLTLLLTGAAALGSVAVAAPAMALPGQTSVQAVSPNDTAPVKSVVATCPSGTVATGGSVVIGGTDAARVNAAVPERTTDGTSRYRVTATAPRGGIATAWQVVVSAVCVAQPPGLEYRTVAGPSFDSASRHTAVATCSPGRRVIGMGAALAPQGGTGHEELVLTAVRSNSPHDTVAVSGHEDRTGTGRSWNVLATAVCADPVPGLTHPVASTGSDSSSPKSALAACPAGTTALAGGFDVSKAAGLAHVTSAFVDPDLPQDRSRQGFGVTGREDRGGFGGDWRVLAQAVCAA